MKQQGFHVSQAVQWAAKPSDEQLSSSHASASSKLADGLQGLMEMCNAGSLTSAAQHSSADGNHVEVVATTHATTGVRHLVKSVVRGLKACQEPERATEGLGGTYFFRDESGRKVAIVKPCDEEPLAPNNPKGFVGRALGEPGLKPTVRVGEAAIREVAAYLLDYDHFARVPHTVLVKFTHPIFHVQSSKPSSPKPEQQDASDIRSQTSLDSSSSLTSSLIQAKYLGLDSNPNNHLSRTVTKLGSLQEFVLHDCDTSEMGPSLFNVQDVHRIAILDIRLFNTDRHAGNILVQRPKGSGGKLSALERLNQPQCRLLPIDHGFCLPEALEPPFFEWLHWPQAMMPFTEEELAYIDRLDAEADSALLQQQLPCLRVESLRTLQVATTLLKHCAAAGLNLSEIGTIMSRPLVGLDEDPSDLENMCAAARDEFDNVMLESGEDEEEDVIQAGDGNGDISREGLAVCIRSGQLCSAGLSGAVSLDGLGPHHSGYSQGSTHSMQSSPDRSDAGPHEMLFALDEEHSTSGSPPPLALDISYITPCALPSMDTLPKANAQAMPIRSQLSHSFKVGQTPYSPMTDQPGSTPQDRSIARGGGPKQVQWGLHPQDSYASSAVSHITSGAELMARSVDPSHFAAKGHFTKGKLQSGQKPQRRMHRLKKAAPAYPPHVAGGAPGATNAVFSDLNSDEWSIFMSVLLECIEEGLADDRWRQEVKKGKGTHAMQNMGMSCPRF